MVVAAAENLKAYLEPEEVDRLEASAQYLRDKLLVRVLFRAGIRVSEAIGLETDAINFRQGEIRIEHLKMRLNLSCPQCGAHLSRKFKLCPVCGLPVEQAVAREIERRHFRTVPVDQQTLALLKEYIKQGGAVERDGHQYIFGICRHRAWEIITDCAMRARLPRLLNAESGKVHNISPHKLRDAFAVNAVKHDDSGDGLRMLQEHLGHRDITTTMKYRKVSGAEQQEWYQKLWQGGQGNG